MFDGLGVLSLWLCLKKSDRSGHATLPPSCQFCHVHFPKGHAFDIIREDDEYVAFRDHNPSAVHHFQVIPKTHIESVKSLTKAEVNIVEKLRAIGHSILDDLDIPVSERRLGFHIPPFNTVNHLHLHVQALPHKSFARRMKYPIVGGFGPYTKGFSWFVEAGQAVRILDQGGQVRISPC
ncbi:HIT-like protein [Leucogyrophana mollusca]|uniref:HIT-like protein n=1 Tax=Leucogyrophana mollusca TaxID=85980 RepID=A0ACB8BR54_9AGAM|nr:HIT-like protein [Leucogyrophana mollusca]